MNRAIVRKWGALKTGPYRAGRNRTLTLDGDERSRLRGKLLTAPPTSTPAEPITGIAVGDFRDWVSKLPSSHVDLLILDPPYNITKTIGGKTYSKQSVSGYTAWLDDVVTVIKPLLKSDATIYICGDWYTSQSIYEVAARHFIVQNRITWEREKGRGAHRNWKNSSEDIWFCTNSRAYTFNLESVKVRRRVRAPYSDGGGNPKDWRVDEGGRYRDTCPSNLWSDITVPFWSMRENTEHPTQKSEKLLARLVLASTNPGDFILDPFVGSGTSNAVAAKLNRRCLGIEAEEEYALLAMRRLELASADSRIQGFSDGVFWERNSLPKAQLSAGRATTNSDAS